LLPLIVVLPFVFKSLNVTAPLNFISLAVVVIPFPVNCILEPWPFSVGSVTSSLILSAFYSTLLTLPSKVVTVELILSAFYSIVDAYPLTSSTLDRIEWAVYFISE
jgi:hypothetical protein